MQGNEFDDFIKNSVDNYEVPYDPAVWESLSDKLDKSPVPADHSGTNKIRNISIAAAVAIGGAIAVWSLWPSENEEFTTPVVQTIEETAPPEIQPTPESNNTQPSHANDQAEEKIKIETPSTPVPAQQKVIVTPSITEIPAPQPNDPTQTMPAPNPSINQNNARQAEMELLSAVFVSGPSVVCEGDMISLRAYAIPKHMEAVWTLDGTPLADGEKIELKAQVAGEIPLTLNVSGQHAQRTLSYPVTVSPAPAGQLVLEEANRELDPRNIFDFNVENSGNASVAWSFGDGNTASGSVTTHGFNKNGFYNVSATLTSPEGCTTVLSKNIESKLPDVLMAPQVFTPNQDGTNETFIPTRLTMLNLPFEMTIFDATGKEVFKTTDASKPWNGSMFNSGAALPAMPYVWKVQLYQTDGTKSNYTGTVTIQR